MKENRPFTLLLLVLAGMLLAACAGSTPAGEPEPDRVATRVAEDLAVAATLTAAVPSPEASPTSPPALPSDTALLAATATQPPPTDAPQAVATATPPPPAATDAPPPPTATPPPPPTNTPPPPPPTPTPVLIAVLPVDGGGAEFAHIRNSNPVKDGRNISLPGFAQNEVSNPMVYRDRIVFRAEVFDANYGTNDGDGIENVTFTIYDSNGNLVHERTENNPAYCVFGGGEPDCEVLVLAGAETRWPGGALLTPGLHRAEIAINPLQGEVVTWLWSFEVDLPQSPSASIKNITIQGDRYAVEFETQGFVPQLPGQHVHFFFDTVPSEQAGVPGSGPWILYGGSSPFTGYSLADRPADAFKMCILVANPDHSVQANSGNCLDLP